MYCLFYLFNKTYMALSLHTFVAQFTVNNIIMVYKVATSYFLLTFCLLSDIVNNSL